jgi:hypothetical protein
MGTMNQKIQNFIGALAVALIISAVSAYGQQKHAEAFSNYTKLLSPEKVYLHTDKDTYFATDTIWISGYVENASYNSEFPESNYIYVELISDQLYTDFTSWTKSFASAPEVIVRQKLRRTGNSFSGHIVVPEMNSTGKGILRGYTYWMLNSPAEYMFYKELSLVNPMKDKHVKAMQDKGIKRDEEYTRIGVEYPYATTETKGNGPVYDVQFLPESGNYIAGKKAHIYVKGINGEGRGAEVYGEILAPDGSSIASYRTDSLGFAKVVVPELPQGKLMATVKDKSGYHAKVQLQDPVASGVVVYGFMEADKIRFVVESTPDLQAAGLSVIFANGSEAYYTKSLSREVENLVMPLEQLNEGIHTISVTDAEGNVYAQRPFAVLPAGAEKLQVALGKESYGKREKVNLTVSVPKEMLQGNGSFSVAVTDMGSVDNEEKTNIKSYMLLKSELNGYIENLEDYFNPQIPYSRRMAMADMLMQTQGWRYYDMSKILQNRNETPAFGREYTQTIAGKVIGMLGNTVKRSTVSFLAPTINFSAMGEINTGHFVLENVDFPENTRFIVSANNRNGKGTMHAPILQDDWFAPMYEYPVKGEKIVYSPEYGRLVEDIYYSNDDGTHQMAFQLDPVVVTSTLITPRNSPSPYPNIPIRKENYRNETALRPYAKGGYDIASYVAAAFPGVRRSPRGDNLMGRVHSNHWMPVHVYLNRVFIPGYEVLNSNLWQMPLSEVESIIYVWGLAASPFQPPFVFERMPTYPSPVLMIRTKPNVNMKAPGNVVSSYPIGWQKPAKMYSPKYESAQEKASKRADKRMTLYWNPALKIGADGKAQVSFYTNDTGADMRVEVEGRSGARQYHYAEKVIKAKK